MDYPVHLTNHLQQLLKSLRKSRKMTQSELAQRLGVVQSRVADIERNPGAVSVEQLLQVLAMLGAHIVVREATTASSIEPGHAQANATTTATLTARPQSSVQQPGAPQPGLPDDEPRGQW